MNPAQDQTSASAPGDERPAGPQEDAADTPVEGARAVDLGHPDGDDTHSAVVLPFPGAAAAWPERDGEFADKFNTMPKYVVSSTLRDPEWTNSTVLSGDLVPEITKLKTEQDGDIVVHGSAQLVQSLIENDLVDELRLMVFPVVL